MKDAKFLASGVWDESKCPLKSAILWRQFFYWEKGVRILCLLFLWVNQRFENQRRWRRFYTRPVWMWTGAAFNSLIYSLQPSEVSKTIILLYSSWRESFYKNTQGQIIRTRVCIKPSFPLSFPPWHTLGSQIIAIPVSLLNILTACTSESSSFLFFANSLRLSINSKWFIFSLVFSKLVPGAFVSLSIILLLGYLQGRECCGSHVSYILTGADLGIFKRRSWFWVSAFAS